MNADQNQITHLLRSKSRRAQLLGLFILTLFFAPGLFRTLGDNEKSGWEKAEEIALALGQTVGAVALAAASPENFTESEDTKSEPGKDVD